MINNTSHNDLVTKVILKHFNCEPEKIERMTVGADNEVYAVKVKNTDYIIRLNERDSLKGSSKYIPLFKSKNIKVPDIIAEDYSKQVIPYNWQILSRIPGVDIDKVISGLTEDELQNIAKEIADIFKKLVVIPTNGSFGYVGVGRGTMYKNLLMRAEEMLATIKKRTAKTGVVKEQYIKIFEEVLKKYDSYFRTAKSQFYFDDMSSKNVIIHDGKFNGLVDLDGVEYGDYLETVGRIKASWYGQKFGDYYTNAIMDHLQLNDEHRDIVTMWALLNRIYWQAEIGIQFNQNTSVNIDEDRVEKGNLVIDGLISELGF